MRNMAEPAALLLVANDREFDAFSEVFAVDPRTVEPVSDMGIYHGAEVGGVHVLLVQCEAGCTTPGGAMQSLQSLLKEISPVLVINGGVAFGLKARHLGEGEQELGDVLIASPARSYENWRVSAQKRKSEDRSRPYHISTRVKQAVDATRRTTPDLRVRKGLLLTGDKLVDDEPGLRRWLRRNYPTAEGGDMEAAGVAVVCDDRKIDWLVAKSISDWADGNKKDIGDDQQLVSARNAATFVHSMLTTGFFSRSAYDPLELLGQLPEESRELSEDERDDIIRRVFRMRDYLRSQHVDDRRDYFRSKMKIRQEDGE